MSQIVWVKIKKGRELTVIRRMEKLSPDFAVFLNAVVLFVLHCLWLELRSFVLYL